jgi:hypothetical protein
MSSQKLTPKQEENIKQLYWLIRESVKINAWRKRALHNLLVNIAPRIDRLGNVSYDGNGGHYTLVQSLGKSINDLAIGFHPTMNWLEKNLDENMGWIVTQVCVEALIKRVNEAEQSLLKK